MTATAPPQERAKRAPLTKRWGFGRTANALLAYTLSKGLQLALFALVFPLYMYRLGYKQDAIGVVTAVGAVTTLVASVPLGLLADRVGRARLYIISAVLVPFPYLLMIFSSSLAVIIAGYMLANFFATIYWSTNAPLLVGAVPAAERVRAFAVNSFFIWGVGALGSVIGGVIPSVVGRLTNQSSDALTPLRVAIGANALICVVGAIPLFAIRGMDPARAERTQAWRFSRGDLRVFGRLLFADALFAFGAGAIVGFLPLFFQLRYGLSPGVLGVLFTISGVLSGVASLAAPLLARRLGELRALITAQAAIAPCVLLTALAPVVWLAVLFEMSRNVLRGTLDPIYQPFAMTRVSARQRGALGGLYNITWATGFSLGPLISGWMQVHSGFGPAFAMSAACYVAAAGCMFLFFRGSAPIADDEHPD